MTLRLKLLEALMDMSRFLLACQKKNKKVLVDNLVCSEVALAADLVVHRLLLEVQLMFL